MVSTSGYIQVKFICSHYRRYRGNATQIVTNIQRLPRWNLGNQYHFMNRPADLYRITADTRGNGTQIVTNTAVTAEKPRLSISLYE